MYLTGSVTLTAEQVANLNECVAQFFEETMSGKVLAIMLCYALNHRELEAC